ncbi:hypothetical protein AVEN_172333-1 [Araneus ventricosus]|uniref:Uncharacterized protein n=1 Tax=Araneus ventricosus TaxID=182803 RepID=A0A4Y2E3U2_ARAVE|nr:hypothetical protein AVEN_172333-1 [Araneus ventricosus]
MDEWGGRILLRGRRIGGGRDKRRQGARGSLEQRDGRAIREMGYAGRCSHYLLLKRKIPLPSASEKVSAILFIYPHHRCLQLEKTWGNTKLTLFFLDGTFFRERVGRICYFQIVSVGAVSKYLRIKSAREMRNELETVPIELAGGISSLFNSNYSADCWKNLVRFPEFHVNSRKIKPEVWVCPQNIKKRNPTREIRQSGYENPYETTLVPVPRAAKVDLLSKKKKKNSAFYVTLKVSPTVIWHSISQKFATTIQPGCCHFHKVPFPSSLSEVNLLLSPKDMALSSPSHSTPLLSTPAVVAGLQRSQALSFS